ncbi:MAG TPA: FAD-binding oxidoreductase [Prolixibacteraceae bacterium]|nr:FAD-binding oxidoreductase [Prolixibacteraceae bacterium]
MAFQLLFLSMEVDFIIVGQGLAGTLLTYELLRLGKSIMVYDDPGRSGASAVAAGLINPVVFRRMTKSWCADFAYPFVEPTYTALEDLLGEKFYYPAQVLKILNEQTARTWQEKAVENELENFVEGKPDLSFRLKNIRSPFGVGRVLHAGRLDIQKLAVSFSQYLEHRQCVRREEFTIVDLVTENEYVTYKDLKAQKVIFCEGPAVSRNPYFNNLIFKHSKGEILDLKIPNIRLEEIISNDVFIMPVGHDHYKVGATYSWDDMTTQTTPEAREELLAKLGKSISVPIKVKDQKAGIRPTMHDRKPVAGFLPHHPAVGIMNGLGSKGALLAPWCARQMAEYMCGISTHLPHEISISRYFKKH